MSALFNIAPSSTAIQQTHSARAEAFACAAAGVPVFPFHGSKDGVCDCLQEHPQKDVGNHPSCGRSHGCASTESNLIAGWLDNQPNANYAIAAG